MATLATRVSDVVGTIRNKINAMMPRLMPSGGTTGQALLKTSNADYDASWGTVSGGSGSQVKGFSLFRPGKTTADEVVLRWLSPYAFTINEANCLAGSGVAASGVGQSWLIKLDGVQIGSALFSSVGPPAFTFSQFAVPQGGLITVHEDLSVDTTLADVYMTIRD